MRAISVTACLLSAGLLAGTVGCSKKDAPAPPPVSQSKDPPTPIEVAPEPPKPGPTPAPEKGTVKFETELKDPKTLVVIDGSEYRLAELDKDLPVDAGEHRLEVKLGDVVLQRRPFTVRKDQRLLIQLHDVERRAAEWVLRMGGNIDVAGGGGKVVAIDSKQKTPLPAEWIQVRAVWLNGTRGVTDQGLEHLSGLQVIHHLELRNLAITDAATAHVQGLKTLKHLDFNDDAITDAGLERLRDLTALEFLHLSGTRITDQGLAHLKGLTNLRTLHVGGTKVTPGGVLELKKSLPGLKNVDR